MNACRIILGISLLGLVACNPRKELDNQIEDAQFIPHHLVVEDAMPGSLYDRGKPGDMVNLGTYDECFSPENLRTTGKVDMPVTKKKVTLNLDANLDLLTGPGNPLLKFAAQHSSVKEVELEMGNVTYEKMSIRKVRNHFLRGMDDLCQSDLVNQLNFIVGALKVETLRFKFKSHQQGYVKLDVDKLEEIVDIELNANWEIENEYTLVINSPKYIGYHMAQMRKDEEYDDQVNVFIATQSTFIGGSYKFKKRYSFTLGNKESGVEEMSFLEDLDPNDILHTYFKED